MSTNRYTKEQVTDIIEKMLLDLKRLPKKDELAEKTGLSPSTSQAYLANYAAYDLRTLIVLPNGKVRTKGGELVWYRNTRGSLVEACFKEDPTLGKIILG